jgi:hypothetical protein
MNILVLDDREETLDVICERLIDAGYFVFRCNDIYEADKAWDNDRIDAIITDLSFAPEGLFLDEMKCTFGSSLTGWIWLINHVCEKKNYDILSKTIIFSEYIDLAEKNVHSNNIYKEYFQSVKKIPKSGKANHKNPLNEILELLKKWE